MWNRTRGAGGARSWSGRIVRVLRPMTTSTRRKDLSDREPSGLLTKWDKVFERFRERSYGEVGNRGQRVRRRKTRVRTTSGEESETLRPETLATRLGRRLGPPRVPTL